MAARRAVLLSALGAALLLSGCGWAPLYADPETGPADAELRAVAVAPIAERIGQRLEWGLRQTLNPDGIPTPTRYVLHTTLQVVRVDLGIQTRGTGTRERMDVNANFALTNPQGGPPLVSGTSHVAESFDILANQYSNVVAEDDARTRAVEELRRDIVSRLVVFFQRRVAQAARKP